MVSRRYRPPRKGRLLNFISIPEPDRRLTAWFREAAVDWQDAVLPAYNGGSIANIPASILDAFQTPERFRHGLLPPVDEPRLPGTLLAGARVIILIVIDGFGAQAMADASARGDLPGMDSAAHLATLTSVFPPTTAAATTSLQFGVGPGTHGMAGYTLFLPEIEQVFNMITWSVAGNGNEAVEKPKPESFLRRPNLYDRLRNAGIDTVIVSNAWFEQSPLTRAQASGVRYRGYKTLADFPHRLLREVRRPGRRFVFGYWDGFDALGHSWGVDSDVGRLELRLIDQALREGLFAPLQSTNEEVAVIITADHGLAAMPRDRRVDLVAVPGLLGALAHRPTGEPRQTGLTFNDGRHPDLRRFGGEWSDDLAIIPGQAAIEAGLFGPPPYHQMLRARTGDVLLLARTDVAFTFSGGGTGSIGGHGSLTGGEMLAPVAVWRFPGL